MAEPGPPHQANPLPPSDDLSNDPSKKRPLTGGELPPEAKRAKLNPTAVASPGPGPLRVTIAALHPTTATLPPSTAAGLPSIAAFNAPPTPFLTTAHLGGLEAGEASGFHVGVAQGGDLAKDSDDDAQAPGPSAPAPDPAAISSRAHASLLHAPLPTSQRRAAVWGTKARNGAKGRRASTKASKFDLLDFSDEDDDDNEELVLDDDDEEEAGGSDGESDGSGAEPDSVATPAFASRGTRTRPARAPRGAPGTSDISASENEDQVGEPGQGGAEGPQASAGPEGQAQALLPGQSLFDDPKGQTVPGDLGRRPRGRPGRGARLAPNATTLAEVRAITDLLLRIPPSDLPDQTPQPQLLPPADAAVAGPAVVEVRAEGSPVLASASSVRHLTSACLPPHALVAFPTLAADVVWSAFAGKYPPL